MANLSPYVFMQELDNDGEPLASGKVYTYEAGTTTPKATYTDATGAVANTNPVVLDSAGRAAIWLGDGGYKFILKSSADVTIKTMDNIGGDSSTAFGAQVHDISTNTLITNVYANSTIIATGTTTLTLLEAAEAGEGFYFIVRNEGTNTVTIDPDGSETIDNTTTITVAPKGSALITTDGVEWYSFFNMTLTSPAFVGDTPPTYNGSNLMTTITTATAIEAATDAATSCILTKVAANIVLSRYNGKYLTINSVKQTIPEAGVSLAPTALSADTNYHVYAYMVSTTMTLEAVATAPALDSASGIYIKTGDATRTYVGYVRTIAGVAFSDTALKRFVRSWYNEQTISFSNELTGDVTTSSATYAILSTTGLRFDGLFFANEDLQVFFSGAAAIGTDNQSVYNAIYYDGGALPGFSRHTTSGNTADRIQDMSMSATKADMALGLHYFEIAGKTSSGTGTWYGGTSPDRCVIHAILTPNR